MAEDIKPASYENCNKSVESRPISDQFIAGLGTVWLCELCKDYYSSLKNPLMFIELILANRKPKLNRPVYSSSGLPLAQTGNVTESTIKEIAPIQDMIEQQNQINELSPVQSLLVTGISYHTRCHDRLYKICFPASPSMTLDELNAAKKESDKMHYEANHCEYCKIARSDCKEYIIGGLRAMDLASKVRLCVGCIRLYDSMSEPGQLAFFSEVRPPKDQLTPEAYPPESCQLTSEVLAEIKDYKYEGLHYDSGKPRVDLVPSSLVLAVAKVCEFGIQKYAERNWEAGIAFTKLLGSAERHLLEWKDCRDVDPESGLNHLHHAAWNLMAIIELITTHPEMDDRPKKGKV